MEDPGLRFFCSCVHMEYNHLVLHSTVLIFRKIYLFVCMCVCMCAHMSLHAQHAFWCHGGQTEKGSPGTGVTCCCELPDGVLGGKFRFSARTVSALNPCAISSVPLCLLTLLFSWHTENRWPSMACSGCQGPRSDPNKSCNRARRILLLENR